MAGRCTAMPRKWVSAAGAGACNCNRSYSIAASSAEIGAALASSSKVFSASGFFISTGFKRMREMQARPKNVFLVERSEQLRSNA